MSNHLKIKYLQEFKETKAEEPKYHVVLPVRDSFIDSFVVKTDWNKLEMPWLLLFHHQPLTI